MSETASQLAPHVMVWDGGRIVASLDLDRGDFYIMYHPACDPALHAEANRTLLDLGYEFVPDDDTGRNVSWTREGFLRHILWD